jgi:hypothetical protein
MTDYDTPSDSEGNQCWGKPRGPAGQTFDGASHGVTLRARATDTADEISGARWTFSFHSLCRTEAGT